MPLPTHSARPLPRRRRSRLGRVLCGTALGALLWTTILSTPSFADPTSSASSSTTSTTSGTSSSQAQINATESQVASIESQIANQQQVLDQDDEHYDQLSVNLTATRTALSSTQASIRVAKAKLTSERTHLAKDAVQSYIGDTSGNAVASLFAAPSSGSQTRALYEQVGVGNVVVDVKRVQATSRQLNTTQSKLLSEQQSRDDRARRREPGPPERLFGSCSLGSNARAGQRHPRAGDRPAGRGRGGHRGAGSCVSDHRGTAAASGG